MYRTLTLSIGTNIGDRELNVKQALDRLELLLDTRQIAVTQVMNTRAVGFDGPDFLNVLVQYCCSMSPQEVLAVCKRIEKSMGRMENIEFDADCNRVYHDRIIDIDILKYGDYIINTEELTIPHPQIFTREYVKELARQLPNW